MFDETLRLSLPSWECGLKLPLCRTKHKAFASLPSWECGLKWKADTQGARLDWVTPFVGVWIEISEDTENMLKEARHSLRGSVD